MPLDKAVVKNRVEIVEKLLEKGADPHLPKSLVLITAILNQGDCLAFLLLRYGADPNITQYGGPSALRLAPFQRNLTIMRTLLESHHERMFVR